MFEEILNKSLNRAEIRKSLMETLTSKGMAKVLLLREMAERTEGKVAENIDMNVTVEHADILAKIRERKKKLESGS